MNEMKPALSVGVRRSGYFKAAVVIALLFTVGAVGSVFLHLRLIRMVVYDFNPEAMQALSPEQVGRIMRTVESMLTRTTWPLIALNVVWIGLLVVATRHDQPKATSTEAQD